MAVVSSLKMSIHTLMRKYIVSYFILSFLNSRNTFSFKISLLDDFLNFEHLLPDFDL